MTMNRYIKTSIASLFVISTIACGALASGKDKGPNPADANKMDQATTGSISGTSSSMMSNDNVGSWQTGKISVVQVSTLNDVDPNRTMLQDRMKTNPDDVMALQAAIDKNAALKSQLESQNVQIGNIVAAEQAVDGSVTFYVK
jgi:hypothetical protein